MIREIFIRREYDGTTSLLYDKPTNLHDSRQIGQTKEDLFPQLSIENSPGTLILDFEKKGRGEDTDSGAYTPVCWPEVQDLFDIEGFRENSHLINDGNGLEEYGSSAYFVKASWLDKAARTSLYITRDRDIKEDGYTVPGKVTIFIGEPKAEGDGYTGQELCSPSRYYFTNLRYEDGPVLLIPKINRNPWEIEMELFTLIGFPEIQKYQELEDFEQNAFMNDDGGYFIRKKWKETADNRQNRHPFII